MIYDGGRSNTMIGVLSSPSTGSRAMQQFHNVSAIVDAQSLSERTQDMLAPTSLKNSVFATNTESDVCVSVISDTVVGVAVGERGREVRSGATTNAVAGPTSRWFRKSNVCSGAGRFNNTPLSGLGPTEGREAVTTNEHNAEHPACEKKLGSTYVPRNKSII
jgi:hypothetical protein